MINIRMQNQNNRLKPRITVVGVGGAGGNAVDNMINSQLEGCEFLVCNTDAQALECNSSTHKIQLGAHVTQGLGAGANPEVGRAAAEESIDEIMAILDGSNMVFVTAGMGGGTGTGAAPVIARMARESGILTVGVVTKPFHFEGTHRMRLAEAGIVELQKYVDTLIIVPNQNLFRIANEKTTFSDAFRMADEVLQSGVRGVTDLMVTPGEINLDFADIKAVMAEMGKAVMGTGEASGERRAIEAAEAAISNPLLDDISMKGARAVIINVTGGPDMTLFEADEAANRVRDEVDPEANIIFGSAIDDAMMGKIRVSIVATGIDAGHNIQERPITFASQSVEAARRPIMAQPNSKPVYTGLSAPSGHRARNTGAEGFSMGGPLPSSVVPNHMSAPSIYASVGRNMQATASHQPEQTVNEAPMSVGHTSSYTPVSTTATARKMNEPEIELEDTYTKPGTAQTMSRPTQNLSAQPRGVRHGNSFIPPKPVDPRNAHQQPVTTSTGDLFSPPSEMIVQEEVVPTRAVTPTEKPLKKSPSLFERFTLGRQEEVPEAPVRAEGAPKLSVEAGGKKDEDELDIPAFLRRQAN